MEVHFTEIQQAKLRELSVETGRGTEELVQEAVDRLLVYSRDFKEQVRIGLEQIARGEVIEEEDMDARVEQMIR